MRFLFLSQVSKKLRRAEQAEAQYTKMHLVIFWLLW
jgi:hypothetical protein